MSNPYFQFKQFVVYHDKCAMKVGVDSVLLGAWADVSGVGRILDIGTGSGLLALMMAQRSDAQIEAIDVDADAVLQARGNIERSIWSNRIRIMQCSLQNYVLQFPRSYDLIISNPPYFVSSLKAPDKQRTMARHATDLSHEDLILCAAKMLAPKGKLCIILPVQEAEKCIEIALDNHLFCTRKTAVFPKKNVQAKRLLLQFEFEESSTMNDSITIETEMRHDFTPEYKALVHEFYLKM